MTTSTKLAIDPGYEALLRAVDRANTPVLSCRPWRAVAHPAFSWEDTSAREVSPVVFEPATRCDNVCQINSDIYRTGQERDRWDRLIGLKRTIEMAIWSDQAMDRAGPGRARRTAGLRALGARYPFTVEIAFLRCFEERELEGGRTMITCEWGVQASLLRDADLPRDTARVEGAA